MTYTQLKDFIDTFITNVNNAFLTLVTFLGKTDYWFDTILSNDITQSIVSVVKSSALTLCVLFFFIDFFNKTLELQWVKWENVMMLCIKMICAKLIVEKSTDICEAICGGLSSIVSTVAPSTFEFITPGDYSVFGFSANEISKINSPPPPLFLDFSAMFSATKFDIIAFIIDILLIVCEVIILGRIFELAVYTLIAPLPLATFAADSLRDIGKGFLKSYAAVSLQAVVLIIMFSAYTIIINSIPTLGFMDGLLRVLALAMGVMQSGQWSKRICNAM